MLRSQSKAPSKTDLAKTGPTPHLEVTLCPRCGSWSSRGAKRRPIPVSVRRGPATADATASRSVAKRRWWTDIASGASARCTERWDGIPRRSEPAGDVGSCTVSYRRWRRPGDTLHVASAITAGTAWLLIADLRLIRKMHGDDRIVVADSVSFITVLAGPMQMHIAPRSKPAAPDHPILAIETTR